MNDDIASKRIAWLNSLEMCESDGRVNLKVLDVNGYFSYSLVQFQKSTFNMYGEKYGLRHDDIYSKDQQEAIATAMLKDGLWRAWYTCGRRTTLNLGYEYPV